MPLTTTATATATASTSTSTSTSYTSTTGQPRLTKKGTGDETLLIKARLLCSQCPALLALPRLLLRLARGLPQECSEPAFLRTQYNRHACFGLRVLARGNYGKSSLLGMPKAYSFAFLRVRRFCSLFNNSIMSQSRGDRVFARAVSMAPWLTHLRR